MAKKIPSYGRKRSQVSKDLGLHTFSADVPLGNTDPTVVQGKMYNQNLPNASRTAKGGLRSQRGKYT